MELRKGQKIPLNENFLVIKFERNAGAIDIDTAAFMLQNDGKCASDDDFIFYGNPRHSSGSVIHDNADDSIEIDLTKIPRYVEKISITATIYEAEQRRLNFSKISGAMLTIQSFDGAEIAIFPMQTFTVETAIVLGEVYRYKGAWKFAATGAGYRGGLAALCNDFGIEVSDEMSTPPTPPPPPIIEITPPKINSRRETNSSRQTSGGRKIELRKGQRVNLIKRGSFLGEIVINLNWRQPKFSGEGIDLDLACLYELKDGRAGAVQALGNLFGSLTNSPYIFLDGDDRSGSFESGETLRVNGRFLSRIQRILIFTFIYEGAARWEEANAVVTVNCPGSPELVVKMDEYGSDKRTCAIALLENIGETFSVEKIVRFYHDSQEMDEDFDWGLRWTVGRK